MSVLWMTSLRPIGKSAENDKIQDLFIKSAQNIEKPIKFSLTQFDDDNVEEYLIKNKITDYGNMRDIPSVEGTSKLSPYLKFGQIHVETIWYKCNEIKNKSINIKTT